MSWLSTIERALVTVAHPDDEVLGCGGLLARLVAQGTQVSVLVMSGVTASRGSDAVASETLGELAAAMRVLGVQQHRRVGLPDNRFDTVPFLNLVQEVEKERTFQPSIVLTHSACDLNLDHRLVHQATVTAFRPEGAGTPRLLSFEVPSSTEWQDPAEQRFRPQCYVDISSVLETKLSAMRCYTSELREPPHPRSLAGIEARARLRGFEAGLGAAEAFQVIREIV